MSMLMTLTSTLTTLVRRAKFLDTGNIRWRFREGDKHLLYEWLSHHTSAFASGKDGMAQEGVMPRPSYEAKRGFGDKAEDTDKDRPRR